MHVSLGSSTRAAAAAARVGILGLLLAGAAAGHPGSARGLGPSGTGDAQHGGLLEGLARAFGKTGEETFRAAVMKDMPALDAALLPVLHVLPRNSLGKLDWPAVRYALHRLFVRQRGWHVKGVAPEGEAWNSSSLSDIAVLRTMPRAAYRELLRRLSGDRFDTHDVVVLAAVIEHLLHGDMETKLHAAYTMLYLPEEGGASEEEVARAIDYYMVSYMFGMDIMDIAEMSSDKMERLHRQMSVTYPGWNETQTLVRNVVALQQPRAVPQLSMSFADADRALEEISHKFGPSLDGECRSMKSRLLKIEDHSTGRVRISDFYGQALAGQWQFQESVPYLRKLGALDESNPSNMRVIIPNYITSLSNCIGASDYHSTCCIGECDELLGHLERRLGAPDAAPEEIAALVAALPSSSSPARGSLSPLSLQRLRRIASSHGGRIPIHGRLFAQWMHHEYPRECPYPHLAGTTQPTHVYDMKGSAVPVVAKEEDMRQRANIRRRAAMPVENAPWVHREELLGATRPPGSRPPALVVVHGVVALAAFVTMSLSLKRIAKMALQLICCATRSPPKKAFVGSVELATV